jgi:hypothetical protein
MKKKAETDYYLQTIAATPKVASTKETTRFQRFKAFFIPRLRQQERLAIAFEEATVRKTEAESEKLFEEAARLAAEADLIRQQQLKQFCENIDSHFTKNDSPQSSALKFAKLLETNPDLLAQLQKVQMIVEQLAVSRGCLISFGPEGESDSTKGDA